METIKSKKVKENDLFQKKEINNKEKLEKSMIECMNSFENGINKILQTS